MWHVLKIFFRRVVSLRYYLMDPDRPKRKKILIISGIIYLLSPIDLVPEPVFGLGLIDDVVLWIFLLSHLAEELDVYQGKSGISREARRRYRGTKIWESEAAVVEEEETQSEGEKKN